MKNIEINSKAYLNLSKSEQIELICKKYNLQKEVYNNETNRHFYIISYDVSEKNQDSLNANIIYSIYISDLDSYLIQNLTIPIYKIPDYENTKYENEKIVNSILRQIFSLT